MDAISTNRTKAELAKATADYTTAHHFLRRQFINAHAAGLTPRFLVMSESVVRLMELTALVYEMGDAPYIMGLPLVHTDRPFLYVDCTSENRLDALSKAMLLLDQLDRTP